MTGGVRLIDVATFILANEPALRLAAFAGVLLCLWLWERWRPLRPDTAVLRRWGVNLTLVALNTVVLRLSMPVLAVGAALYAEQRALGLLHQLALPAWLSLLLAVVALDCLVYWQHRLFHRVPLFWRLHAMHHSDTAIDASTGLRFHPLEILLSMLIKLAAVLLLGAPVAAVVAFEVLLNATSIFNHGNVALPPAVERWLRRLIVTPAMHRVHHSVHVDEHNRNFGFNLSVWDRLFGSYTAQPRDGHLGMRIGLDRFRERRDQSVLGLLWQPFRAQDGLR